MTDLDDRAAFEEKKRVQALALGRDRRTFEAAVDALHAADRNDYPYLWSWMGVPIIQLPADIIATQEIIWATKPDLIVETGVARGGSVLFMASILELIGKGKVVGIDIDIRAHNPEFDRAPRHGKTRGIDRGRLHGQQHARQGQGGDPRGRVGHGGARFGSSREHVLAELRSYGPLVTMGCYPVVADTILGHLDANQTPRNRSQLYLKGNEPLSALSAISRRRIVSRRTRW